MNVNQEYLRMSQEVRAKIEKDIIDFFKTDNVLSLYSKEGNMHAFYFMGDYFQNLNVGIRAHNQRKGKGLERRFKIL